MKTTASIPTKFCTTPKTIKCSSLVVQMRPQQTQNGRRLPFWTPLNRHRPTCMYQIICPIWTKYDPVTQTLNRKLSWKWVEWRKKLGKWRVVENCANWRHSVTATSTDRPQGALDRRRCERTRPAHPACYSLKFVRTVLFVNFAYAKIYVRKAIHDTFLRTKNRKSVRKYTNGLSCHTTEIFRKYGG